MGIPEDNPGKPRGSFQRREIFSRRKAVISPQIPLSSPRFLPNLSTGENAGFCLCEGHMESIHGIHTPYYYDKSIYFI